MCGGALLAASEPFYHADRILDFNVLIYVISGVIYVTEEDTDYEIHEGEMLFLRHGLHHFGRKEIARGTRWYYVHFYLDDPPSDCRSFSPDASELGADEPLRCREILPKKLTGLHNSTIEHALSEFILYCHSRDLFMRMKANSMFALVLSEAAAYRYRADSTLSAKICRYLNDHCDEPFSAAALEKAFFLSYKRMAAVFRREQGMTMQQYHNDRRMSKARFLLTSTILPINEIADTLGFDDPLYFSRCFHAYTGLSPSAYRTSAKSDY